MIVKCKFCNFELETKNLESVEIGDKILTHLGTHPKQGKKYIKEFAKLISKFFDMRN